MRQVSEFRAVVTAFPLLVAVAGWPVHSWAQLWTPVSVLYGEDIGFAVTTAGILKSVKDIIERVRATPDAGTFAFGTSAGDANHMAIVLVM